MLELKALSELNDAHLNQAINYLEAYNLPIGLLINFESKNLILKGSTIRDILITTPKYLFKKICSGKENLKII